jgi:branched-chain amino acid transport system ATP-binding protein
MSLLRLDQVSKQFGHTRVLHGVSLRVEAGERHALIGPNGAGKSTLFHLISGLLAPDSGSIAFRGAPIHGLPVEQIARRGIARSFQISQLFPRLSVFENLRCALLWPMGYGCSLRHLLGRERALNARTDALLENLGLQALREVPAGELAYAAQRALELGLAIASDAPLILLDEPVAGMSHSEAAQALALIRRVTAGRTLLLVEHDMSVVFELADRITVLAQGEVIASDTPARIRASARVQEVYLGTAARGQNDA